MPLETMRFAEDSLNAYIDDLADLLCDVVNGGASVSFLAPFSLDDAKVYWLKVDKAVQDNEMLLILALEDGKVLGTVQVALAWQANAPHRAEIQKLLVHSAYRRRGIAAQLMQSAEAAAKNEGRWLLFLDTERGSGAEPFYEKIGYTRAGIIPQHSLNGAGKYEDTVIFYKLLQ
jgi:GNAT superfamily N-acetyltransferase